MTSDRFPLLISVLLHTGILGFASWKTLSVPAPRGNAHALTIEASTERAAAEAVFTPTPAAPVEESLPLRELEPQQRQLPAAASLPVVVELSPDQEFQVQVSTEPREPFERLEQPAIEDLPPPELQPEERVFRKRAAVVASQPPATASPAPIEKQFGVSDEATPPRLEHSPPPAYPPQAIRSRWEGVVYLEIVVEEDGSVSAVAVKNSSGHPVLDQAAVAAVRQWRFVPATRRGASIDSVEVLPIRFRL